MTVTPIRRAAPLPMAITDPATAAEGWRRYVKRTAGDYSVDLLAAATLIAPSRIMDWTSAPPSADDVLAYSTALGLSSWEALNSAGLIPAFMDDVRSYLAAFSMKELREELNHRSKTHAGVTHLAASI